MKRFLAKNIGEITNPKFDYIREINEELYVEIKKSLKIIDEVDNSIDLFLILGNNYKEIIDFNNGHFKCFIENMGEPMSVNMNEYTLLKIEINRLILNYLSSFRMLIDHCERTMNKRFGKESKEYLDFKFTLKEVYDENFEYRFIYKLRNFCQHCGIPVSDFIIDNNGDSLSIEMCFSKKYLLDEYDSWGVVLKNDINGLDEKFFVNEIISINFEIMRKISEKVHSLFKDVFINSLNKLEKITQPYRDHYELVVLSEISSTEESYTITIDKFPFDKIDKFIKGIY